MSPKTTYGYDTHFLDQDTPFRSWFLGLFVTDGHLSHKKEVIFGSVDKQLIDSLIEKTNYINTVNVRKAQNSWKAFYRISFMGPISKKLLKFGFKPGRRNSCHTIFIPSCISDKTFPHFLRGVIDGDGCLSIDKNGYLICNICNSSKLFIQQLHERIKKIAPTVSGKIRKGNRSYDLIFGHQDSICVCEYVYKDSLGIRLERKFQKYTEAKDKKITKFKQVGTHCTVDACLNNAACKGLCTQHYYAQIKYPNYYKRHREAILARNRVAYSRRKAHAKY